MNAALLIKKARRKAGLTQSQLAERMGTAQSEVARLESPGSNPRIETLARAVAAADASLRLSLGKPSGIDPTLIHDSLKQPAGVRLRTLEDMYGFAQRNLGKARRRSG